MAWSQESMCCFFSEEQEQFMKWSSGLCLIAKKKNRIMLPRKKISKIRCCPCTEIIDTNNILFLSALIFFAVQNPLIMASFASGSGDRKGYSAFGADFLSICYMVLYSYRYHRNISSLFSGSFYSVICQCKVSYLKFLLWRKPAWI